MVLIILCYYFWNCDNDNIQNEKDWKKNWHFNTLIGNGVRIRKWNECNVMIILWTWRKFTISLVEFIKIYKELKFIEIWKGIIEQLVNYIKKLIHELSRRKSMTFN